MEFRKFLDTIEAEVPSDLNVHLIVDNYATHQTALIHNWLAKRSRFHRLRQVLGVAPVRSRHQQGLQIVPTALPRLPTAKLRTEVSMKILEGPVHPLQSRRIHSLPHLRWLSLSRQLSYQGNRRCNTSRVSAYLTPALHPAFWSYWVPRRADDRQRAPEHTRSSNGPEFAASPIGEWLGRVGARTLYIEPSFLRDKSYVEGCNGKLRDQLLDWEFFTP